MEFSKATGAVTLLLLCLTQLGGCASTRVADPTNACGILGQSAGCVPGQGDSDSLDETQRLVEAPVCAGPDACEAAWAAARRYVLANADFTLRIDSSDFLETYELSSHPRSIAARIVREPAGSGSYRIVARFKCATDYGCVRPPRSMFEEFGAYVRSAMRNSTTN